MYDFQILRIRLYFKKQSYNILQIQLYQRKVYLDQINFALPTYRHPPHTHTHQKAKKRKNSTLECKGNSQILNISDHKNVNQSKNLLTPLKLCSKNGRGDPVDRPGKATCRLVLFYKKNLNTQKVLIVWESWEVWVYPYT